MAKTKHVIDEKQLTKGELRKLNALRKSIGPDIGDRAFVKWWEQKQAGGTADRLAPPTWLGQFS